MVVHWKRTHLPLAASGKAYIYMIRREKKDVRKYSERIGMTGNRSFHLGTATEIIAKMDILMMTFIKTYLYSISL